MIRVPNFISCSRCTALHDLPRGKHSRGHQIRLQEVAVWFFTGWEGLEGHQNCEENENVCEQTKAFPDYYGAQDD